MGFHWGFKGLMETLHPKLQENGTADVRQDRRMRSAIFQETRGSNVTYVDAAFRGFLRLEKNRECREF